MAKKKTTAKKTKKEPVVYVYYGHKTRNSLFVADKFIYEMCVYQVTYNMSALYECKETAENEFRGYEATNSLDKNGKRFLQFIELIGAPIEFLKENRFYEL